MASPPRTVAERTADLAVLENMAQEPLDVHPDELSELLRAGETIPGTVGVYRAFERYVIDKLYEQHGINEDQHERIFRIGRTGIQIGRRILASSIEDYAALHSPKSEVGDLEPLRGALHRSGTLAKLLHLPNETANEAEAALGIFKDGSPLRTGKFEFVETSKGLVYRDIDGIVRDIATKPFYPTNIPKNMQRCPGRKVVIQQIWPAMVDLAVDTPEVFPAHLEVLQ